MDFTTSDAFATDGGTGHRLHQDSAPVTTVWSAKDANQVIWSLMKLLADAGISAAAFDPTNAATYNRVSLAVQALAGVQLSAFTGANQSLVTNGYQKLPGGLILQWGKVAITPGSNVSTVAFVYPLTFPNGLLDINGNSDTPPNGAWNATTVIFDSASASGANCIADTTTAAQVFSAGRSVRWVAIGH